MAAWLVQGGLCGGRLLLRLIESHGWCGSCTPRAPGGQCRGLFFSVSFTRRATTIPHRSRGLKPCPCY